MRTSAALSAFTTLTILTFAASADAASAAPTRDECKPISISYTFDNDQSGGWWVVKTSMTCTPATWFKRYNLEIYDRPFTEMYVNENTGYITSSYQKTTIIPATPINQKKSACVSARSELYFFNKDMIDSESRNACFNTAIP